MANLGALLIAAVAIQAVLAGQGQTEQRQNRQIQHLAQHIQQVSSDVAHGIQNFQAETSQGRRYLAHQANDYAYNVQKVVYYMQQAYNQNQHTFQGETQKNVKEIAQKLSEVAYNVQQAMNTDVQQLKTQFKTQVQEAAEQAQDMAEVAQQVQQSQGDFKQQMKEVLYYFLSATQQLRTQIHHQQEGHQEVYGQVQQASAQAINAVQAITGSDEQTAEDMSAQTQQFAQKMNHMIHKIQQWANNHHHHHHQQQQQQGEGQQQAQMYMQQVANQMSEMHADLQQAANAQAYPEEKINAMKAQMVEVIRGTTSHMQKMVQVGQTVPQNQQHQDGHSASHVAKSVLVDFLAAVRNMKTEMEIIAQSQQ